MALSEAARYIIYDYESMMMGAKKSYSTSYIQRMPKATQSQICKEALRFIFETYMGWGPEEVRDNLTNQVAEWMKITFLLQHLPFPDELKPKEDTFYYAYIIYPYDNKNQEKEFYEATLKIYQKVLDGTIVKFPKNFMQNAVGDYRAQICLKYMIQENIAFSDVEELYAMFAGCKTPASIDGIKTGKRTFNINAFLKEKKLLDICTNLYDSPLEYLHRSLGKNQRNECLYHYYYYEYVRSKRGPSIAS